MEIGGVVDERFHLVGAKAVGRAADGVKTSRGAVAELVHAVAGPVEVVVELGGRGSVVGEVVVRVSRGDGEVVVGLVLDEGVVPPVSDEDRREVDQVGVGQGAVADEGVLGFRVGVEDGTVVPAVAFGGEVVFLPCVLGEGAHESLEGFPEVGGGGVGRGSGEGFVGVGVRSAR